MPVALNLIQVNNDVLISIGDPSFPIPTEKHRRELMISVLHPFDDLPKFAYTFLRTTITEGQNVTRWSSSYDPLLHQARPHGIPKIIY